MKKILALKFDVEKPAGIFFRKNFLSGKNSSILEIEQKKLKKGDFVNGKIVDGRIGRTKRKRIR